MKKIIMTLIAVLSLSCTAFAQQNDRQNRQRMNPEEWAKRRTEMMVEKYGLNAEQAAALQALNEKSMQSMRGQRPEQRPEASDTTNMRKQRGERGERRNNGQRPERMDGQRPEQRMNRGGMRGGRNMEAYNEELQKIMTPEQWKAYQADMEQMRQRGPRR